ncbi:hypothetical protein WV31_06545 [Magnetospirillum sp. ME-1]|uniref:hypothetical protein n=1 Tax=Magnetospirillum sp. ME-1 TaxID=1639348 RepID=UPI000A17F549|nr:hypothetical protein [Magnetospirillum sp. ME-1]ARJ65334.1 hypothetical protein WV31_06545 [Magnetospirillum sp. ME-1]
MARSLDCTCLQGLDLALKWASHHCDPDLVRCTASVAHDCLHRDDCRQRAACDLRLHQIDDWLAENGDEKEMTVWAS